MKKIFLAFWLLGAVLTSSLAPAQSVNIDSLRNRIRSGGNDTGAVFTLLRLADAMANRKPDSAIFFGKEALALAGKINFAVGSGYAHTRLCWYNCVKHDSGPAREHYTQSMAIWNRLEKENEEDRQVQRMKMMAIGVCGTLLEMEGKPDEALSAFSDAIKMAAAQKDVDAVAKYYNNAGAVCFNRMEYSRAVEYYTRALSFARASKNKYAPAYALTNLANIYSAQNIYHTALEYYYDALKLKEEMGDEQSAVIIEGNMGNVYLNLKNYEKALACFRRALSYAYKMKLTRHKGVWYTNIGNVYSSMKRLDSAIYYRELALKMHLESGSEEGACSAYSNLAGSYLDAKMNDKALACNTAALALAQRLDNTQQAARIMVNMANYHVLFKERDKAYALYKSAFPELMNNHDYESAIVALEGLALLDSLKGNFRDAYSHCRLYTRLKDSISNDENTRKQTRAQLNYEFEKRQLQVRDAHRQEMIQSEQERKRQRMALWFTAIGFALLLCFAVYVGYTLSVTRRQKKIIESAFSKVEEQKLMLEEKQLAILDSIYYARRIQQCLLTPEITIGRILTRLSKS